MKKSRNTEYIVSFDHVVLVCYLLLCLIGVVMILDIASMQSSLVNFYSHILYLAISLLSVILVLYFFNLEKLRPLNPYLIYLGNEMAQDRALQVPAQFPGPDGTDLLLRRFPG